MWKTDNDADDVTVRDYLIADISYNDIFFVNVSCFKNVTNLYYILYPYFIIFLLSI